jgi:uridine kinase
MRIPWQSAHEHISAAIADRRGNDPNRVVVVGITGRVGAGKSTLAARLTPCIIATDNYLPDYDSIPYHERDQPHHADVARLAKDLASLRRRKPIRAPIWSHQTHRREGYRQLSPADVVACEGIHALHGPIAALLDLKIFVEAPSDVRWSRWETLELTGQRGWGVEKARTYFNHVAEPTFAAAEPDYLAAADIIVSNS